MAALISAFFEKFGRLSPAGPKVLAFGGHCSEKFQPILYCFITNFMLEYEDSENIKLYCVDTIVFNLHQIKQRNVFGTPDIFCVPFAIYM